MPKLWTILKESYHRTSIKWTDEKKVKLKMCTLLCQF